MWIGGRFGSSTLQDSKLIENNVMSDHNTSN